MALAVLTLYCTEVDVQKILSEVGADLRLDDDPTAIAECLAEATEDVNFRLFPKYDPSWLSTSNWVARKAAVIAACYLCARRGNPVPESLMGRCDKALEDLDAVADGLRQIPNLPLRRRIGPMWHNVRVDPRYRFKVVRVETQGSTSEQTTRPQNVDYVEAYTYEI